MFEEFLSKVLMYDATRTVNTPLSDETVMVEQSRGHGVAYYLVDASSQNNEIGMVTDLLCTSTGYVSMTSLV